MVLIAEDDPDDRLILRQALEEVSFPLQYHFVEDGEELVRFLMSCLGKDAAPSCRLPALILLDLNLPKRNGREILREIKKNPSLTSIPVIVLTTSNSPEDIAYAYGSGANSYIVKPGEYGTMLEILQTLEKYWFSINKLPSME